MDSEYKKKYIGWVLESLINDYGLNKLDAGIMIRRYELSEKIDICPDIAYEDDPRSIAREICEMM